MKMFYFSVLSLLVNSRMHRTILCAFTAILFLSCQVVQAFPPGAEKPREVSDTFIMKQQGWVFPPNRFEPPLRSGIRYGRGPTNVPGIDIDVSINRRNSLGHSRIESWRTDCPPLQPGMLLPLFGVVGRLEKAGQEFAFKTIPEADLPAGVKYTGVAFPMFLGVKPQTLELTQIGKDDNGELFAEIVKHQSRGAPTRYPRLLAGGIWTIEYPDTVTRLRVEQIVAPDEDQQIPGWITLRPEGEGTEPRQNKPVRFELPDSITLTDNQSSELFMSRDSTPAVRFVGGRMAADTALRGCVAVYTVVIFGGPFGKIDVCPTVSPPCEVGMVLPLCGGVGRVESISDEGVKFKLLARTESPAGMTGVGNDFPLILGSAGSDLLVDRIGIDADGILSADLTQTRDAPGTDPKEKQKIVREKFSRLSLDSSFVLRDHDTVTEYRVTELVPPNSEKHVVGWVKLRPIEGGILERKSIE